MNIADQIKYIKNHQPDSINKLNLNNVNNIIYTNKESIISFLAFLKNDENLEFTMLIDEFATDFLEVKDSRFEITYNLLSLTYNNRLSIKISLTENDVINSATEIFRSANWFEREIFDMYGIKFNNHPDLRRILTDYNFKHHPLRKDFPLSGYEEVRYNEEKKKIIYEKINLTQEYRNFNFESPWEGFTKSILNQKHEDI